MRKRFQIHLSTAVVMMFVAGGIIWANFTNTPRFSTDGSRDDSKHFNIGEWQYSINQRFGWPMTAVERGYISEAMYKNRNFSDDAYEVLRLMAALDALVALILLALVWFLCEWLIRRRAARKGA